MDSAAEKLERDANIDRILVYLNEVVERHGCLASQVLFYLENGHEDAAEMVNKLKLDYIKIAEALKVCISRKFVKHGSIGEGQFNGLILTESGQGRAISVIEAKPKPERQSNGIHIGNLNTYGNTQIGDNNIQNIEQFFGTLVERIDAVDATDSDKREAKNLLKKFLEHPLTSAALGAAASLISARIGG